MSRVTETDERRQEGQLSVGAGCVNRGLGLALVVVGLLAVVLAAAGVGYVDGRGVGDTRLDVYRSPGSGASAMAEGQVRDAISVQTAEYEPGQTSGWHQHNGVHVVTVVSGTLTIHDRDSGVRTYGPGDTYIGGRDVHLAKNEGEVPARMVVTFVLEASDSAGIVQPHIAVASASR